MHKLALSAAAAVLLAGSIVAGMAAERGTPPGGSSAAPGDPHVSGAIRWGDRLNESDDRTTGFGGSDHDLQDRAFGRTRGNGSLNHGEPDGRGTMRDDDDRQGDRAGDER